MRSRFAPGSSPPTVLVVRHHGLGDLVTVQPALRALRKRFPDHRLVTTCPSWLTALAQFFGTADELISELPCDGSPPRNPVDPAVHQNADRRIITNVARQAGTVDVLVSLRTPGPELGELTSALSPLRLVSYRFEPIPETVSFPELDFTDHILARWRRLLQTIGVDPDDGDLYASLRPPAHLAGFTVVHVGAGSPSRQWPADRWVAVVRYLSAAGHTVVLTGSPGERQLVSSVCNGARLPADAARYTGDIWELTQLIAGARLVLCADTGPSHLATAFRRPSVTLFGPVPPAWWGPPPGNPQHRTIWAGRLGDPYASAVDPGLMAISPEFVVSTVEELMRERLQPASAGEDGVGR
jgi:ADP-heptose:LPS heptosyltransferase